jgi:hypothetical protein
LKVTQPDTSVVPAVSAYKAYIVENGAVVTPSTANNVSPGGTTPGVGAYFNVAPGSTGMDIKLKHGQKIAFGDLHVGASYDITQAATPNYTPSFSVNGGGVSAGSIGAAWTQTPAPTFILDTTANSNANISKWDSAFKSITVPTGLDINDVPFVMLLVLAALALFLFVVLRYRKRAAANR